MLYNVKAALFDLDGVIVFTDRFHFLAWKRLADEQGWRFDETMNHQLRGVSRMASLNVILIENGVVLSDEEKADLADRKNRYYVESLEQLGKQDLYPGAVDFIQKLKARNVLIGLCSASRNAQTVLDRLNISDLFDCVVTGADIQKTKPDPEIFQMAAKRLNRHPFNCMVFEDAESGIEAAQRGDFRYVGVGDAVHLPNADQVITEYASIDMDALIEFGCVRPPEVDGWKVICRDIIPSQAQHWESLFCLSNGYMGVRGAFEEESACMTPWTHPGTYINGVCETVDFPGDREFPGELDKMDILVNLFDWRLMTVVVDGEPMSLDCGRVLDHCRELDMKIGVLNRSLIWESPSEKQIQIETIRLVSMARRHSAAIRCRVTPLNFSGSIEFVSSVNGAAKTSLLDEFSGLQRRKTEIVDGDTLFMDYRTARSKIDSGLTCAHSASVGDVRVSQQDDRVEFRYRFDAEQGQAVQLDKHVALASSLETDRSEIEPLLLTQVRQDRSEGFDVLLQEQAEWWRQAWDSMDIEVAGCEADQQAIRLSLFHLRQNHTEENKRSISATGITGDNYHGWIFWDTEVFMFPFFVYHDPAAARALLEYRCNTLDGARRRAQEIQLPGACYGWSTLDGTENNSYFPASTAQYHVNADIGYAIWRYLQVTQDFEFVAGHCMDSLLEICRMFAGLGKFIEMHGNRFCFNYVTGPDEYNYHVNNNCFTNLLAQKHFSFSLEMLDHMARECPVEFAELKERIDLSEEEIVLWRRIEKEIYVPFNEQLGIHEQDDGFFYRDPVDMDVLPDNYEFKKSYTELNMGRMQVCKQADVVLSNFLLSDEFSPEIKRKNFDFYLPRTKHVSSLSSCIHSIMAAEVGHSEMVYDLLRQTIYMDLCDLKKNTSNGIHFACTGGVWMVVVNGLAGMRDDSNGLQFRPFVPDGWTGYSFKILYRSRNLSVKVATDSVSYTLLDGDPLTIWSNGEELSLAESGEKVTQQL